MISDNQPSVDNLLIQATCAVLIDGKVKGTAWLVSEEGHLLTAGHLLGTEEPLGEVEICFLDDTPRVAYKIQWEFNQATGADFAILRLHQPVSGRMPLPVSLTQDVSGEFKSYGYGISLRHQSSGSGLFVGIYNPQNFTGNSLFQLRSPELGEKGYSGSAVYSTTQKAVVAIQIEASTATVGAGRDTVLAMPLYRIAERWKMLTTLESLTKLNNFENNTTLPRRLARHFPNLDTTRLTWLHISDFHIKVSDEHNNKIIRDAFLIDLERTCREESLRIDLIFVTGDLAFGGRKEEYHIVIDFLDKILSLLSLTKERLFIIPGNHDVNRQEITGIFSKNVSSLLNDREAVYTLLSSPDECKQVCRRLQNYTQFLDDYFDLEGFRFYNNEPSYYTRQIAISKKRITVIGLNSAWLSSSDRDRHNLAVGEKQIRDVITNCQDSDVKIALIHHPFDWLKDFDESDTQSLLEHEVNFILRGHLHKTRVSINTSPDSICMHIAAGALSETRLSPNAYNLVTYNIDMGEGVIFLRRYSDESGGFFSADTQTYRETRDGQYKFALKVFPNHNQMPIYNLDQLLVGISAQLLKQVGNRRTAYPTDLNFRELYEDKIYITPQFLPIRGANVTLVGFEDLAKKLANDINLLIIGEPGAGKSFLTYMMQRHFMDHRSGDIGRVCIPIDLRLFVGLTIKRESQITTENVLRILSENHEPDLSGYDFTTRLVSKVLFIVDGIDELAGDLLHVNSVITLLSVLGRIGKLLVTCRTRDFEYVFASYLDLSLFDLVLKVKEWDVENEFVAFIRNLETRGLFVDEGFTESVKSSPVLRSLAARPLHARMLTFVSNPFMREVVSVAELYSKYLGKYATVVDTTLMREECLAKAETYLLWRDIAWFAFQSDMFIFDKIPLKAISDFLISRHNLKPSCVPRLLQPLFNYIEVHNSFQLQFVHYSFFEYLVAQNMADSLLRAFISNSSDIYPLFVKDMTPEIRHYLVDIINNIKPRGFGKWLTKGYIAINQNAPSGVRRQVANNLLVYILGRVKEDISEDLWMLLRSEKDDFLRTCLYWGLCAVDDTEGVEEYITILDADINMRNLNRGYLLYYYGDLDRSKDPPYIDDKPHHRWTNTKLKTLQFKSQPDYHKKVSIGRRVIDLYTFYDFCIFHKDVLQPLEVEILSEALNFLAKELRSKEIMRRLHEMHQSVILEGSPEISEPSAIEDGIKEG